jgi:hypothetical protein
MLANVTDLAVTLFVCSNEVFVCACVVASKTELPVDEEFQSSAL